MRGKEMGIRELSYFEALGESTRGMRTIAVAGTHGKTTTTGMLAKVLADLGASPTAIVGSIVSDFGSNFLRGDSDFLVVEACEYRDHLLTLSPEILVITNLEWDHTDYFASLADIQSSFRKLAERVPVSGAVVADSSDPAVAPVVSGIGARVIDYTDESVPDLLLIGEFNKMNARAAKAAARVVIPQLAPEGIDASLASFRGSWRRFEYKGETAAGVAVYDDYAHHPTAIEKTIHAARELFPGKRLVVAFHPHLYSRTRDLMGGFADALAHADDVVLAPIYPAREDPIPGVTSEALAAQVSERGIPARACRSLADTYRLLADGGVLTPNSVLITMGAGDVYKVAEELVSH